MIKPEFTGLSDLEVETSRLKLGSNRIPGDRKGVFWPIVKEILGEPLFMILAMTSLVYFLLGELNEGVIMLVALLFISAISFFQEHRSRNAVEALKKLSAPLTQVIRNGMILKLPADQLVTNDLIIVEDGDIVPADAQVLKANDLSVDESILTGESLPVSKRNQWPENVIFQGTTVMSGACTARITAVGEGTALGKIGLSLREVESTRTPLQIQIRRFIHSMIVFGLIAFLTVWGINYFLTGDLLHSLLHGLTLAMSVLPEEIPVAFSTFMALGAYHLYKKQIIARSPHTVETLGAATVICTDKTGTLTENRMQLSATYDAVKSMTYDYRINSLTYNHVLEYAMWASEVNPFDPMEKSIHEAYSLVAPQDLRTEFSMVHEYPLGGIPPIMTHVFRDQQKNYIIAVKGSVEGVLKQSRLSPDNKVEILRKNKAFALQGFRVLAVGKSECPPDQLPVDQGQIEFEFLGLIAFYDPPKPGIRETIRSFYDAGIKVKMITGDYAETASSIAHQIHFNTGSGMLSGEEVMKMDAGPLTKSVVTTNLFVRMFPAAKLKVIQALKANGDVVAMTGDGVNDAPALKAAHIGIAMGLRGSEVAKKTASLVLVDDDLSRMTDAIALGRRIYENLKKAVRYIISIHIPILLIVTLPLLLFWKFTDIFSPVHVIFLELIMGPTCSIAFENEPLEAGSMQKPPRKMNASFFSMHELSLSIIQGLVITLACLGLGYYYMIHDGSEALVRTIIYTTLIFSNLFLTLTNRSFQYSFLTTIRYKNVLIPVISGVSLIILSLSLYLPWVRDLFRFQFLTLTDLLYCVTAAIAGVFWIEGLKWYKRSQSSGRETVNPLAT